MLAGPEGEDVAHLVDVRVEARVAPEPGNDASAAAFVEGWRGGFGVAQLQVEQAFFAEAGEDRCDGVVHVAPGKTSSFQAAKSAGSRRATPWARSNARSVETMRVRPRRSMTARWMRSRAWRPGSSG